jgi:uncharacterized protein YeeX (DUF496 family)
MKGQISTSSITCSTPEEEHRAMVHLCELFGVQELTSKTLVSCVEALINDNQRLHIQSLENTKQKEIKENESYINTPLVAFLYQLIRDHVTCGHIERILKDQETSVYKNGATGWTLSNKHIESYAREIEQRLNQMKEDLS